MTLTDEYIGASLQGCSKTAHNTLHTWALDDFRASAIPDCLTLENIQVLSGQDALQVLLEDKIADSQKVTSYITASTQRLLECYDSIQDGIWVTSHGVPYAKPINPRMDPHKLGKYIKYETPPGARAAPILPQVDKTTAAALYQRYGVEPLAGQDFWDVVELYDLPVAMTEGLKKALSLIAHGVPAIALRGITQWHLKGTLELHPELKRFATPGRQIYILFDQDTKPKTIANVHRQAKKLGTVLDQLGCRVHCPVWDAELGKGIDDVLYQQGNEAQCWLEGCLKQAPTLQQYKRNGQITAALNAIARYNRITFPIERATEGDYLPMLPPLTPGTIHVVDATMNTGKTYRIGRDWVQAALRDGHHVLVLSPLNSLGQQTAKDWGILHIHDQGLTGEQQRAFWQAAKAKPGLVLCPDSIAKLPVWFWSKPVLLIVDEGNQVTEHICQGNTLKSRYTSILECVARAAKHAIASGGAIVLSEDGLPDRAVHFWQALSGTLAVRCFQHRKHGIPWDCQVLTGKASGFRKRLLDAIGDGQRILFVTTSQREAKRLERILTTLPTSSPSSSSPTSSPSSFSPSSFPPSSSSPSSFSPSSFPPSSFPPSSFPPSSSPPTITRIDSETNQNGAFNLFFKAPDQWLQQHQPDVLILSPSAKSGVSIEGNVSADDAYFDAVWAYFPALSTDTHLQMLGRYRPPVPRTIFVPPFIAGTADESLGSPKAIRNRLHQNLITLAQVFNLPQGNPELAGIEAAIADYLSQAHTVSGRQKVIAQVALVARLEDAGHYVTTDTLKAHKSTTQLWTMTQDQIWQDEALDIATATPADAHTLDWAYHTLDSHESSREARLLAHKVRWRDEFPGVTFDDAEECYEALCQDYGAMRKGVLLQARAENLETVKASDRAATESILTSAIRAPHRLPKNYIKAAIIDQLGLLKMLDGQPWTNEDKRAIAIKQTALKYANEITYWLQLNVKPTQTPCEIVNKLLKRLGLEIAAIGRPGPRKEKRARVYAIANLENPTRIKLLQAAREKFSAGVSDFSKSDLVFKESLDTVPQPVPVTSSPPPSPPLPGNVRECPGAEDSAGKESGALYNERQYCPVRTGRQNG